MRADLGKTVLERRRWGSQSPNETVRRERRERHLDALPRRSPMRPHHAVREDPRENYTPLRRFLRSRCGRPWNRVCRELRQHFAARSAAQRRVFEGIERLVTVHAKIEDGVVYARESSWQARNPFFVDPLSGLLEKVPAQPAPSTPPTPDCVERDGLVYVRHRSVWYRVDLAPQLRRGWGVRLRDFVPGWDVLLKTQVGAENDATRTALYGRPERYAVTKTPLNRKALKALGLWRR